MPTRRLTSPRLVPATCSPPIVTDPGPATEHTVEMEDEGGLAGAVRSEDGDPLTGRHGETKRRRVQACRRGTERDRVEDPAGMAVTMRRPGCEGERGGERGNSIGTVQCAVRPRGRRCRRRHRAGVAPREHRQIHPLTSLERADEQRSRRSGDDAHLPDPSWIVAARHMGDAHPMHLGGDHVAVAHHEHHDRHYLPGERRRSSHGSGRARWSSMRSTVAPTPSVPLARMFRRGPGRRSRPSADRSRCVSPPARNGRKMAKTMNGTSTVSRSKEHEWRQPGGQGDGDQHRGEGGEHPDRLAPGLPRRRERTAPWRGSCTAPADDAATKNPAGREVRRGRRSSYGGASCRR